MFGMDTSMRYVSDDLDGSAPVMFMTVGRGLVDDGTLAVRISINGREGSGTSRMHAREHPSDHQGLVHTNAIRGLHKDVLYP